MNNQARYLIALAVLIAAPAAAQEKAIELKAGKGRDVTASKCAACHSLDYIQMNSPFLDKKGWDGVVNKMVNVYGAPLSKEEIPTVVDYLTRYYGK